MGRFCTKVSKVEDKDLIQESGLYQNFIEKYKEQIFSDKEVQSSNLYMTPIDRDKKTTFRSIVYEGNEFKDSDLTKEPSQSNLHPFDPNLYLPPTKARSLAAYVNYLPVLQNLVDIGVDLLDVDTNTNAGKHIIRLDWEKDILPKLQWLVQDVEVDATSLGDYLTRNPHFLLQDLNDMKTRVNYLESKKFSKAEIAKLVTDFRYWLNNEVKTIDKRLGWIQKTFKMSPTEVRKMIVMEPRVIMFGTGPIQRIVQILGDEGMMVVDQKNILKNDPRVFMMDPGFIQLTLAYATKNMKLTLPQIVSNPLLLRCSISSLKRRHSFLKRLNLAQYDPELPNCIPLDLFLHPSDKVFAERAAMVTTEVYDKYIKCC
uniref:Ankyrin repeat protein n=1 Tax=Rhabditophanes sp. KR3021 TaxID=114890 RepID=A0AC35TGC2_9BILA